MAQATLTIDLDAIAANWRALDALTGAHVETAAVLKAGAYGLGVAQVAPRLAAAGARTFFVALAEEAAPLRQALGPGPVIWVLNGCMPGDAPILTAAQARPLLNSGAQIADWAAQAPDAPCGLQLDSGMNRLGLEPADLAAADLSTLDLRLVISHLASADTPDHPQNAAQRQAFQAMTAGLPGLPRSLAATGGTLMGADYHYDLVRPGIGLFGGAPFADARPVVQLDLPVIQIRDVAAGEAVGYGAAWTTDRPARIATVASGYADGLIRAMGGRMALYAGDTPCPAVGRVSMDLITVDVTALDHDPDRLSILNDVQRIDDLAAAAGTIGYEILTALGPRYERVYKGI